VRRRARAKRYYWVTGRVDDVLNISGHRIGSAEIESALVAHPAVAEAAVVGFPHDLKGMGMGCYCVLKNSSVETSEAALVAALKGQVRKEVGPFATPDYIILTKELPTTRSGKIMRRILRKILSGETSPEQLGDVSTLKDPSVVDDLIAKVKSLLAAKSGGAAP
jgi:acetyl-CoA synthetase